MGGDKRVRTAVICLARAALYQLSYVPLMLPQQVTPLFLLFYLVGKLFSKWGNFYPFLKHPQTI